jgi:Fic family protein
MNILDISSPTTANKFLNDFIQIGILEEKTQNKRNKEYVFEDYLNLFR